MAVEVDLTNRGYVEGDDVVIPFSITEGGSPYDFTDVTKVWFTAKTSTDVADDAAAIRLNSGDNPTQVTYGGADPGAGKISILIRSTETAGLARHQHLLFDVQVLRGGLVNTLITGKIAFRKQVTLATS